MTLLSQGSQHCVGRHLEADRRAHLVALARRCVGHHGLEGERASQEIRVLHAQWHRHLSPPSLPYQFHNYGKYKTYYDDASQIFNDVQTWWVAGGLGVTSVPAWTAPRSSGATAARPGGTRSSTRAALARVWRAVMSCGLVEDSSVERLLEDTLRALLRMSKSF